MVDASTFSVDQQPSNVGDVLTNDADELLGPDNEDFDKNVLQSTSNPTDQDISKMSLDDQEKLKEALSIQNQGNLFVNSAFQQTADSLSAEIAPQDEAVDQIK